MDGNRRWAKERNLPVLEGHRRVTDVVLEPLIQHAAERGVKYLTFWAFSTENWKRDKKEVEGIMRLFRYAIKNQLERLHKKGVRIRVIGDLTKFAPDIRQGLIRAVEQTKNNTKITVVFALNYGGRDELLRAIRNLQIYKPALPAGGSTNLQINEKELEKHLDTAGIPDPELIVRTSGEQRLSGFLLWQSEYSEFYFPTWYMPEFTPAKLDEVIAEFNRRQRRFGK